MFHAANGSGGSLHPTAAAKDGSWRPKIRLVLDVVALAASSDVLLLCCPTWIKLWSEMAGQLGFAANAEPTAPSTNPQTLTSRPFVKTHDPAVFVNHDGLWSRALERWMQGRAPF
jgi:hypothetical protein